MADPASAFRTVLFEAGLQPGEVAPDGVLRRCPTENHPKRCNGAYKMWPDGRGGWFEDHADGRGPQFWSASGGSLPPADRARLREEIERKKSERLWKQSEAQQAATLKAREYLCTLPPAKADNAYLRRKGVSPCPGVLDDGVDLIVPVNGPDRRPISYQRITPNRGKKFAPGCPVAGGFFVIKGDDGPLLVCEGLATGLSLLEATGRTVLCAFSARNLTAVASMARRRYSDRPIIIAGDNDTATEEKTGKNPGVEAATAAAMAVGGLLAIPAAGGDWNDIHQAQGLEAVRAGIDTAMALGAAPGETAVDGLPDSMPLPDGLPPVAAFDFELLPGILRPWAADIVDRMQCPPDYVAVAVIAALAAVVGRRIGIRPQASTDWTVTANQWAMLIGRPGVLKSPAMEAALSPLK